MAGSLPHPRADARRAFWPRDLQRGALVLGVSSAVFWFSFASGRWIIWVPSVGPIYVDLLLAWVAVVLHVSAWPDLWVGLRDLRARQPNGDDGVVAWRAFLLTLVLIFAAIVILPIEYHAFASTEAWILILYVTAFPYLGWTFVPILALHGVVFARVARFLDPRFGFVVGAGAFVLFAVAGASTAVILQNPGATTFIRSWSVGRGILPAAALAGYVLIALGLTARAVPAVPRSQSWTSRRVRWAPSGKGSFEVFRQIPRVLDADREADESVRDPLLFPLLLRHTRVSHRRRMFDQRLDAAEALREEDHL
jgi:hypothetical protein